MKINTIANVNKIIIKTAYIDSKNNLLRMKKASMNLLKPNLLSIEEQKHIIEVLKKQELPKKYICSGILENQVAFMSHGETREFDFDDIDLTYEDLVSLEQENCTHLNTFEHKTLKLIQFKPTPLFLSDLNEIFIVLREVSKTQIKTRKNRMLSKRKSSSSNTNVSKSITRKHLKK